jgi:hypothetical protein
MMQLVANFIGQSGKMIILLLDIMIELKNLSGVDRDIC